MSEEKVKEIADAAELIVCGYAILRDGGNFKIVNLNSGHASLISSDGKVLETSMDDIEIAIALRRFHNNRQFLAA